MIVVIIVGRGDGHGHERAFSEEDRHIIVWCEESFWAIRLGTVPSKHSAPVVMMMRGGISQLRSHHGSMSANGWHLARA
jgi:hypothetical protein